MAERVVLAEFAVDASGVVSGLRAAEGQTATTARKMGSSLDALTTKMFSVRSAALKIGAAFGFAGVAFTAANAVATLTKDLIASTTWFKNASAAVTGWYQEVVKGIDALGRLASKVQGLTALGALTDIRAKLETQAGLQKDVAAGPNRTIRQASGTMSARGLMMPSVTERPDPSGLARFETAKLGVKQLDVEINNLARSFLEAGGSLAALEAATGRTFEGLFPAAMEVTAKSADKAAKTIGSVRDAVQETLDAIELPEGGNLLTALGFEETVAALTELDAILVEGSNPLVTLEIDAMNAAIAVRGLGSEMEQAAVKAAKLEVAQSLAVGFADAITRAFSESGVGLREAIGSMLKDMAKMYAVKALENLALGIMASTPWGAAMLGPPAPYFKAAAVWGVAASVAGAAGAVLGGGGGGRGGHGGGIGGGSELGSARAGPSVTVVINGSLIGMNMSRDEFARAIADDIEKARGDGGR